VTAPQRGETSAATHNGGMRQQPNGMGAWHDASRAVHFSCCCCCCCCCYCRGVCWIAASWAHLVPSIPPPLDSDGVDGLQAELHLLQRPLQHRVVRVVPAPASSRQPLRKPASLTAASTQQQQTHTTQLQGGHCCGRRSHARRLNAEAVQREWGHSRDSLGVVLHRQLHSLALSVRRPPPRQRLHRCSAQRLHRRPPSVHCAECTRWVMTQLVVGALPGMSN
jgi:hypothetical protein